MSDLLGKEPEFKVTVMYGHCELRSWFEFDGEKLIGMGSKKTYDQNGKLTDYSESPTGLVLKFPNAQSEPTARLFAQVGSTDGLGVAVPPAPTFETERTEMPVCAECGMPVDKATTYHPYAACLMFKACQSSDVVQANLDAVVAHGMAEEFERVRDGIANAAEDWPHNEYYPPTIAEMIREIGPTPATPNLK